MSSRLFGWVFNKYHKDIPSIIKILMISSNYKDACVSGLVSGHSLSGSKRYSTHTIGNSSSGYMLASIYEHIKHVIKSMSSDINLYTLGNTVHDLADIYIPKYNHVFGLGATSSIQINEAIPDWRYNIVLAADKITNKMLRLSNGNFSMTGLTNKLLTTSNYEALKDIECNILFSQIDLDRSHLYLYIHDYSTDVYAVKHDGKLLGHIVTAGPLDKGLCKLLAPDIEFEFVHLKTNTLYKINENSISTLFTYKESIAKDVPPASIVTEFKDDGNNPKYRIQWRNTRFYYNNSPITSNPNTNEFIFWYKASFGYTPVGFINMSNYTGTVLYTGEEVKLERTKEFYFFNGVPIKSYRDLEHIHENIDPNRLNNIYNYVEYMKYPLWIGAFGGDCNTSKVVYTEPISKGEFYIEEVNINMRINVGISSIDIPTVNEKV